MKYIILIFFFIYSISYSQEDSLKVIAINKIAHKIDNIKGNFEKSLNLKIDTINVAVKKFKNKVETESVFLKSNTKLSIELYFDNDSLILARIKEQSPTMEDLFNHTVYYYEKKKRFSQNYYHNVRICLPISFEKSIYEMYGYNEYLGGKFLETYVEKLVSKI